MVCFLNPLDRELYRFWIIADGNLCYGKMGLVHLYYEQMDFFMVQMKKNLHLYFEEFTVDGKLRKYILHRYRCIIGLSHENFDVYHLRVFTFIITLIINF